MNPLPQVNVISTHFKAGSGDAATRENQAGELTNYITTAGFAADDYLIIGADLNIEDRDEAGYNILTNSFVTDDFPAHDQDGDYDTNIGRTKPYDHVLADSDLDALHVDINVGGFTYTGMVFDTEQFADHLLPELPGGADPLARAEKEGVTQIRGGAWCSLPLYCESSFRNGLTGRDKRNFVGFRIVLQQVP